MSLKSFLSAFLLGTVIGLTLLAFARADSFHVIELKEISLDYKMYLSSPGTPISVNYGISVPATVITPAFNPSISLNVPMLQYTSAVELNAKLTLLKYGFLDSSLIVDGAQILNEGFDTYQIPLPYQSTTIGLNLTRWLTVYGNYSCYLVNNNLIQTVFPIQSYFGMKLILYRSGPDTKDYLIR